VSPYIRDLIERVVATFAAAFFGFLVMSGGGVDSLTDWSVLLKAAVAGGVAVATLAKTLVAKFVGNPGSASLDPANPGPVIPAA
jgi:hypothetical protein